MIDDKRLKYIMEYNGFDYYSYTPTFGKWLYMNYDKLRFQRWVRFLLEYMAKGRYVVYYMAKDDCVLGYCLTAAGGRRLKCSDETDIVLGPYFIRPEYRGKGFSTQLINTVINKLHNGYKYAFDYIAKDNIPSLRATEACGFERYAELNIVGFIRKLVISDSGTYIVYRKRCIVKSTDCCEDMQ